MYLKSIEVQGFKSFAHKIKFDFHNGITGIVGPNGSGKSNVADAVRWVLGEQRIKQLRGGTMQDVIFSGTENRKPLSYASVAITLDNSDHKLPIEYEEVTVARKLYRSGESEYLINGSPCRLKDVNELFYDTGIGKEGYSIIGQGQIDKILSGKPEERRELFDEAAGIVKFKRRKSMSVKKLEEERQNLLRVNDILAELEKQVGPLEKQAETAKEYLKKKEQLKTYDINMFLLETERIQDQIRSAEEKLNITRQELADTSCQYDDMKAEYEAIEEQVDSIDALIEKSKSQLNETTILKQQLQNQIELLKEQIHSSRMNDEHYDQRARTIDSEIRVREGQLDNLQGEQRTIRRKMEEHLQKENLAREALIDVQTRIAGVTDSVDQKKNDIMEILNNRASTKAKIQKYDTMLEQIQVRRAQISRQIIETESDADKENAELTRYRQELKEISCRIIALAEQNTQYEEKIKKLQEIISKQTEQFRLGQTAYHREQSRLDSLKNITERYDGYGNSIRKVMDNRDREKGLLGVVADIIKVSKEYEIAVETALGGNIQNIVTADEETAKRMIQFLKKNKHGRATFLPLTSIRANAGISHPEALKETGVIGAANQLVKVEERYQILADYLLGRTLVVDHIDHGTAIARKYHQTIRIVTLEGELINPGGSMTGGAFKNTSNLLSRRREIEEFEKTVRKLKQEMDEMEVSTEKLRKERAGYYEKIDGISSELQKAYVIQNTAKMNADQAESRIRNAKDTERNLKEEDEKLIAQIADIMDNQESINVELDTSESLEKELTKKIQDEQKLLDAEHEEETKRIKAAEEIHLIYANLEQKLNFVVENITRIREENEKFHAELAKLEENKSDTSREIEEKEAQIAELRQTIEDSKDLFDEIQKEIDKSRRQREELNNQHKVFLQKREDLAKHMADLDKEVYRLESQKAGYEEAAEKQINYMWEEYEITYNHAKELRDMNLTDLAKMKKRIQELKSEIRSLGNVNVNAIEEYKQVSERYEFLKNQHDDLVEAEATLEQIIAELDEAMRKQFKEQFAMIAEEFDAVFKELFGGGKGTLELMEDEDVLDAGIRIIAQPPGKKLQNMMQLSGGEKALTAIALLFAIQNQKPSPFCLLDEIEAALDDNNVVRFAQYLHKLTKNTQFIVITHRRGTMTAADRLYGITMQEKGVSTLVSVSLLENELEQ
ncbi:chromosome segregation protein SMC [Faecalicatena contorta]|uniref:chromosome segregation protein SMC n=1 Tax=Faecalicatena contorta TaxID=39482 RepID=UPI001F36B434|nr:chromosome segregation protein SMC [Faecalicatena contorta]MCF2681724.1 chromosome segregation protein SMC [Faecalicatena contorta]